MKASDLLVAGFPHGTQAGYVAGCKGGICPAVIPCRTVWMRYRSDLQFRRAIDAGTSLEQIRADDDAAAIADVLAEREARLAALRRTPKPVRAVGPARSRPRVADANRQRFAWTAAEDQALRDGHAQNLTVSDLAKQLGRGRQLVKDHAALLGLRFRDGRKDRWARAREGQS